MEKKDYTSVKTMKFMFIIFVSILCLGTILLSKPLYIIMGASQYTDMRWMFCLLAIAEMFRQWGAIIITFQSFMKNTSINVICLSILGALKFIFNWLTLESLGITVLFYSTIVCYFIYFITSLYFGYYKEKKYIQSVLRKGVKQ